MELERISGNNGTDEKYVVVAKSGHIALGVYLRTVNDFYRPVGDGKHLISITGRVRVAALPGIEATDSEINEAFKTLPIEKFANPAQLRASLSLGLFLNQTEKLAVSGAFDVQKVGFKLFDYLLQYIDESLFLVTREEMHEIIKSEIGATVEDGCTGAIEIALEIAQKDGSFRPGIDSVMAQLEKSRKEAEVIFQASGKKALKEAVATAQVLVDEYLTVNPGFTTSLPETTSSEFQPLAFLYEGLIPSDDGIDDEDDEGSAYDA
jgi:hypothetical protein